MGFEVTYPWSAASSDGKEVSRGSLGFRLIHNSSAHGTRFGDGSRIALPSEIVATSVPGDDATEKWHLMLSVRNNGRQTSLGEPSDTIASFEVDIGTGVPKLIGLIASGGRWPRTFAVSKDGSFVAVADQYIVPGRLVVFSRDPKTGVIDDSRSLAIWETNTTLLDGQSISHVLWE
ncbi:putative extracellular aldonolactonase [Seiridium unicorne]|uniref:Extracellular aldonolactonase n=1 Tax=Seiridium unicorne TaxID=138068 RepID=A0ABR2UTN7_9PEZI